MSLAHGEHSAVASHEDHASLGREYNWWGMIFFICSEALIFANLLAAYLYLEIRGIQPGGSPWLLEGGKWLPIAFPAVNTIFLFASSYPAIKARQAIQRGNQRGLVMWLSFAILLGSIFLGGQVYEYITLMNEGLFITTGAFGSAFFTLTGFHGLHVFIGLIFLVICLIRGMRGDFDAKKHFAVEAGEMYWHFVDGVWVFVFTTVYLVQLLLQVGKF